MAPTGTPPLPPEIAQKAQPSRVFDPQNSPVGQGGKDPHGSDLLKQLGQKIQELEQWAGDTMQLIDQVHPPMQALLMPIAQAGQAMKKEFVTMVQRSGVGKGSPQVPPQAPPNPGQGQEQGAVPQAA